MSASLTISAAEYPPEPLVGAQRAAEVVATDSATIAVAELAERLRRQRIRVERATLANWLLDWQRAGITEQVDGRWRLTDEGLARFGEFGAIGGPR